MSAEKHLRTILQAKDTATTAYDQWTQDLSAENRALKEEVQELKARLIGARVKVEQSDQLKAVEGEVAEVGSSGHEAWKFRGELDGVKAERDAFRAERDALKNEIDALRRENDTVKDKGDGMAVETGLLRDRVREEERRAHLRDTENHALEQRINDIEARGRASEHALQAVSGERDDMQALAESRRRQLQSQETTAQQQLQVADTKILSLTQRLSDANKTISSLQDEKRMTQTKLQDAHRLLRAELPGVRRAVDAQATELKVSRTEATKAKNRCSELQEQGRLMQMKIDSMREMLQAERRLRELLGGSRRILHCADQSEQYPSVSSRF